MARYPRTASAGVVSAVQEECLTGAAPGTIAASTYRAAVAGIEEREYLKVERLEGYSFASVRAAYLGFTHPDLVAAVSTPFPVGASAVDFYSAVARHARVGLSSAGSWESDSAAAYYQVTGTTGEDVDVPSAARAWWQVDSEGTVSLSRVGYYSEACGALKDWPGLLAQRQDSQPQLGVFASVHAVCSDVGWDPELKLPRKTCFAILSSDPNTPWVTSDVTRGARIKIIHSGTHGKVGIPSCP